MAHPLSHTRTEALTHDQVANLENVMLGEGGQTQKATHRVNPFMCNVQNRPVQTARKSGGCPGGGGSYWSDGNVWWLPSPVTVLNAAELCTL